MVTFGLILALSGLFVVCACIGLLMADIEPFGLWIILLIVSALVSMIGIGLGVSFQEQPEETNIQIEQVEENHNQYNYCPYCGEEIK